MHAPGMGLQPPVPYAIHQVRAMLAPGRAAPSARWRQRFEHRGVLLQQRYRCAQRECGGHQLLELKVRERVVRRVGCRVGRRVGWRGRRRVARQGVMRRVGWRVGWRVGRRVGWRGRRRVVRQGVVRRVGWRGGRRVLLRCWGAAVLRCWGAGCWGAGVLRCWGAAVLGCDVSSTTYYSPLTTYDRTTLHQVHVVFGRISCFVAERVPVRAPTPPCLHAHTLTLTPVHTPLTHPSHPSRPSHTPRTPNTPLHPVHPPLHPPIPATRPLHPLYTPVGALRRLDVRERR